MSQRSPSKVSSAVVPKLMPEMTLVSASTLCRSGTATTSRQVKLVNQ
ncbi:hypothetical protein [Candidatus Soleaferrea massiliensis]|nr:hypothetical protein [Candidatus Soleaferrea massiliensis]